MSWTPWAPELPVGSGVGVDPPGFSVSRSEEGRSSSGSANIKDSFNPITKAWGTHRDRVSPLPVLALGPCWVLMPPACPPCRSREA